MSRFQKEINGLLGDWWKEDAEKRVVKAVLTANNESIKENDGAIKWISNGHYVPEDFCELLKYANYDFNIEATAKKREIQEHKFIKEYKKNQRPLSREQLAEMCAAFGAGTVVVDVFTGKRTQL